MEPVAAGDRGRSTPIEIGGWNGTKSAFADCGRNVRVVRQAFAPTDAGRRVSRLRGEEGFVLVAVLWLLVGVAALALVARLAARDAVSAALNRADLTTAAWRAEDCVERVRAAATHALENAGAMGPDPWGALDAEVARSELVRTAPCTVTFRAAGAGVPVNTADEETLRRFFAALGRDAAQADSLASALEDWRDGDDAPRAAGAEAAWYRAHGIPTPRNGPFADARELARVRGFDALGGLDSLVEVDSARVPLNQAPLAVLAALPGMSPETVARMGEMRMRGERVAGLIELEASLSPGARMALERGFAALSAATTPAPDAWTVTARAAEGTPPVAAVLEVRLARAGTRVAVTRRRTWTE